MGEKSGQKGTIRGRIWRDVRAYWQFGAAFLVYDRLVMWIFGAFCPSVIVAGLPCPGCGMTRSVFYFATGQWEKGWQMNPLGILWLLLAVYFCFMRKYCFVCPYRNKDAGKRKRVAFYSAKSGRDCRRTENG